MGELRHIPIPSDGYRFGYVEYGPAEGFGPRTQYGVQLVYVYEGSMRCTVDDTTYTCVQGEAILLFPGHSEVFEFSRSSRTRHGWVERHIPSEELETWKRYKPVEGPITGDLLEIAAGGLAAAQQSIPSAAIARDAMGQLLLEAFLVRSDRGYSLDGVPSQLVRAIAFVDDHWRSALTAADIAEAAASSTAHLNRLFNQHYHTSTMRYLRHYRAERARQLIATTALKLETIAELCGFANPFHLSRVIHEELGQTPKSLRASADSGRAARDH